MHSLARLIFRARARKLDIYRVTLEVVNRIGIILKSKPIDRSLRDQIVRSSTSILLDIAEGTGKRSSADRGRYHEIACGSAMETAAALDVLVARQYASTGQIDSCKTLLRRVIAMPTKMTVMPPAGVSEEEALYGPASPDHDHE